MSCPDGINSFVGFQSYRVVRWKRHNKQWIEIWLELQHRRWRCGRCGRRSRQPYDRLWASLRDMDIVQHQVWLWIPRYRIVCRRCGVRRAAIATARPQGRCARRFERWLFRLTASADLKEVAALTGADWKTIKDAEIRYIVGLLRKRNIDGITEIGIDKVAEKKGHRYLSLVTDLEKRRVIWVGRNRDRATLRKFFCWFGKKRTRRLKCVVIDMHDPYELEIRARCAQAKVVYDHFHVIKPLSLTIDTIRRRLQSELPPQGRRVLKGSRYLLLRNREDLTRPQRVRLRDRLRLPANEMLQMAYLLKEDLRAVFRRLSPQQARVELKDWKSRARESDIPEILAYVKMLDRRRFGVQNFFKLRKTNGQSEGFNNVIKTVKKKAYGFHDWRYFCLKILRKCGKLRNS